MTNTLVFFHNDEDGVCSAMQYIIQHSNTSKRMPVNYGHDEDIYEVVSKSFKDTGLPVKVVFLDWCPLFPLVERLIGICKQIVIFDHHKDSCEGLKQAVKLANLPVFEDVLEPEQEGIFLNFDYTQSTTGYLNKKLFGKKEEPRFIAVSDRDIGLLWDDNLPQEKKDYMLVVNAHYHYTKPRGLKLEICNDIPEETLISWALQFISDSLYHAEQVVSTHQQDVKDLVAKGANSEYTHFCARACPLSRYLSDVGNALSRLSPTGLGIAYSWDSELQMWKLSFRSHKNSSISALEAVKFLASKHLGKGGGHPPAAGFSTSVKDIHEFLAHIDTLGFKDTCTIQHPETRVIVNVISEETGA
jgi:hypothetical protein